MKTLDQALDWVQNSIGKSFDLDGKYGAQCKDYVNAYAKFLGVPFKPGNAITLWAQNQTGWSRVAKPKKGDVFVADYVVGGVNYGHTGVVQKVGILHFTSIDQNWYNSNLITGSPAMPVQHRKSYAKGYLRTQFEEIDMYKGKTAKQWYDTLQRCRSNNLTLRQRIAEAIRILKGE